jgi:hypothetical protein
MRSSLFWDVTRRLLVVTDVSEQTVGPETLVTQSKTLIREDVIDSLPETSEKRFKAAWPLNMEPIYCHESRYLQSTLWNVPEEDLRKTFLSFCGPCIVIWPICLIKTNKMHFSLLIYFNNHLRYVSNRLSIHHQEVFYYTILCSIRYFSCIYVDDYWNKLREKSASGWFLLRK